MRKLILFLVVLLVYLQYRLWLGDGGLLELWNIHQEVEAQREENARLRERNEALDAQVLDLKQGLDGRIRPASRTSACGRAACPAREAAK